jgi:hypothetical protein
LVNWDVERAHFSCGRNIAGRAALLKSGRFRRHWDGVGIFKVQLAAGEVRRTIPSQFQNQRLVDASQPNLTGHPTAGAVVDLTARNMFVKSPGHNNRMTIQMSDLESQNNAQISNRSNDELTKSRDLPLGHSDLFRISDSDIRF